MPTVDKNRPTQEWIEQLRQRFPCEREIDRILTRKLVRRAGPPFSPVSLETLIEGTRALLRSKLTDDFEISEARWLSGGASKLQMAFKLTWNATVDLETRAELAPTLDEMRVLYAFYVRHPHAPEAVRARLEAARKVARDEAALRALDAGETLAAEAWRIEKIRRIAALDTAYPTRFALGVAYFRHGEFATSAESFRDWLHDHPDGPWTLRARNHLRAALDEAR